MPLGTNLGLFHLLGTLLSGRLLQSRGAVIPALADFGLGAAAMRRAWAALAYGHWGTAQLLAVWQRVVQDNGQWQAHRHGGYRPVACDLVEFWRPRLQRYPTKHYCAQTGKALPATPLGIEARIGAVGPQRLAMLCLLVRPEADDAGEPALQRWRLHQMRALLARDEVLVTDRGFPLVQLQGTGIPRYVSRGPTNFTARRATLPAYCGKGRRPLKGPLVRPLPRPVGGLPLWAKQMLGAARQFVFAPESRQRLPEVALLAGASWRTLPPPTSPLPTGFWDRAPRPTAGRLRRALAQVHCQDLPQLPPQLRKKQAHTAHLPTGVCGHRRQKNTTPLHYDRPLAA